MAKRKKDEIINHPEKKRRGIAKKKRNKGKLAMEKAGKEQVQWTREHDPLLNVKGKQRHEMITGGRK